MSESFPPRGSGIEGRPESVPHANWARAALLGPNWDWEPGKILLGRDGRRLIGFADDRHAMTLAGSGTGKTSSVLKHNVQRWQGSIIIMDPKGELYESTAVDRLAAGHNVYRLDPFGVMGEGSHSYNPFDEIGFGRARLVPADAALNAEAMIIQNKSDQHWSDAARNLVRGLTLLERLTGRMTLRELRRQINSTESRLSGLLEAMVNSDAYDGVLANIGTAFLGKMEGSPRELQGILSTAQEQTVAFDDVAHISDTSDFEMADLNKGRTTVYVILPGMRMATHFRWMRLIVQMALAALERHPVPRGGRPVLFMLEEFAALGPMRSIEAAAGLMRGYGLKMWFSLQDLTQLKTHYPNSWETFIANSGVVQAFGNSDVTTTEHLSKMLGRTVVVETMDHRISSAAMGNGDNGKREQLRSVPLLEPAEITQHFARETGRQMILVPGRPPIYMDRMPHHE